jgi:hypothetical protein
MLAMRRPDSSRNVTKQRRVGMDFEPDELRRLPWRKSRIPKLDALEAFVPTGAEDDEAVEKATALSGLSRWYPVEGGHRVVVLYEGGEYDDARLSLVEGGWDHEHCERCGGTIEPMALCWATADGPSILLCAACHSLVMGCAEHDS